jgi:hypothetical protein
MIENEPKKVRLIAPLANLSFESWKEDSCACFTKEKGSY